MIQVSKNGTLTLFVGIGVALLWVSGACAGALQAPESESAADAVQRVDPAG